MLHAVTAFEIDLTAVVFRRKASYTFGLQTYAVVTVARVKLEAPASRVITSDH